MPATSAIPNKEEFSVSDLVTLFDVAERTVQYWIAKRYFPNAYRRSLGPNSAWIIPRADVVAFDKRRRKLN